MFAEVITVPDMTPIKARLSSPPAVACGDASVGLLRDQAAQNVGPAQCVHEVEDEHHQRDQQQIPAAEHELESVGLGQGLLGDDVLLAICPTFAAINDDRERHRDEQTDRRDQHQRIGPDTAEHDRGQQRAECCAQRGADAHEREEALAALTAVQVVRERPELSDRHHVEDADPDVEREPDPDSSVPQHVEDEEVRREE